MLFISGYEALRAHDTRIDSFNLAIEMLFISGITLLLVTGITAAGFNLAIEMLFISGTFASEPTDAC